MDKSKTVFDYISEAFMIFGFTVAVNTLLSACLGDIAKDAGTLYVLGKTGLSVSSLAQFLLLSVLIVLFRILFLTDLVIRKKGIVFRNVAMVSCVLILIVIFVFVFEWFPADMPLAWVSFAVCFVLSLLVSSYKEKLENKKMAEALEKIKQGD